MKPVKFILPTLGAIVLLLYSTIIFNSPAALGTGHNQGRFGGFGQDSCGNVEVTDVSDNCPTGHDAINSYYMGVTVKNVKSSAPITIRGEMRTYWCTNNQLRSGDPSIGQGAGSCYSNGQTFYPVSPKLAKGQSYTFWAPSRSANVCGAVFQDDFNYSYGSCHNSVSSIHYHAAYGYCASSSVCTTPTPTQGVTPMVIVSPTQGVTPTPTSVTPTPTEEETPTPTQAQETPMPTPTQEVTTGTNTNTCTGVDQSSNNNGNNNNNCNQQQQSQQQNQYNNNNQSVNLTLASPQQPEAQTQSVLGTTTVSTESSPVTQLPSTGAEANVIEILMGLAPLGVFIRKIA